MRLVRPENHSTARHGGGGRFLRVEIRLMPASDGAAKSKGLGKALARPLAIESVPVDRCRSTDCFRWIAAIAGADTNRHFRPVAACRAL